MTVKSRVDQAKIIWYQWDFAIGDDNSAFQSPIKLPKTDESKLSSATAYDISDHLVDFSYEKNIGQASGAFSMTLKDSADWSRFMKAGEWLTLYLTANGDLPTPNASINPPKPKKRGILALKEQIQAQLGGLVPFLNENPNKADFLPTPNVNLTKYKQNLRSILMIERVGIQTVTLENGLFEVSYVVTGKDLGVCLEDTDLWFNMWHSQKAQYDALAKQSKKSLGYRNIRNFMEFYFNAFFYPEEVFGKLPEKNDLVESNKQWLLPDKLLKDIGIKSNGPSYFGRIPNLVAFEDTLFENNNPDPMSGLEGNPWSRLKEMSQPEFHELFLEIEDGGEPRLTFRPIPWALNKTDYPKIGAFVRDYLSLTKKDSLKNLIQKASQLFSNPVDVLKKKLNGAEGRTNHRVDLYPIDLISYNVGPDFHSRYNHFLIGASSEGKQLNSLVHFEQNQSKFTAKLPMRNDQSIKRHGLRKRHFDIQSYLAANGLQFKPNANSVSPQLDFLVEANALQKDYWGNAEDFYSGSITMTGDPKVKIGKVLVTNENIEKIPNFVFYIESYQDTFQIGGNGVGEWTQTLGVTRGIELADLEANNNFSAKVPAKRTATFIKK